ncbi:MAG TPA: glycosyltransferase family 87 protein [Candidatus Dormibacteraeota bacterium]|nr:glycosyltransferase family 87 protein [Candidatus Dormibacteraeota bacterium]
MVTYLRERTRLWAVAGIWGGALLVAFDLYAAVVTYIPGYRVRNDFRLIYGAAVASLHRGFGHLYDLPAQKAAVEGLGHGFYWSPFLNPPPLIWLAAPFTLLPFDAAIVIWSALLVTAALLTWYLVAPGGRLVRVAHLALWLGLFPVAFGLMVGQPVALVAAAVAGCWWLAERDRPVLAGLVLSLAAIKPQVALLAPLCLLVSGHWRVFAAWLAAAGAMVLLAAGLLGIDGIHRYQDVLALASQWEATRRYAVAGSLGLGPQVYAVQAVVVAAALVAAWNHRHSGVAVPLAAGITASLLFTPYVGFQDFAVLVVAGWLVLRSQPSRWQVGLLVVGYALLELALLVLAVPILVAEAALLLSLVWPVPTKNVGAPAADGLVRAV